MSCGFCELNELIGKKIVAVKADYPGNEELDGPAGVPAYILFDDKGLLLVLQKQDTHTFHDCYPRAREVRLEYIDDWDEWMKHPDATENLCMDEIRY